MHIMVIPFHDDMSNVKDYRVDHGHIFVSENLWKNSMYYYLTHAVYVTKAIGYFSSSIYCNIQKG